jgi:hypothetical protein
VTDDQESEPHQSSLYELEEAASETIRRVSEFDPTPYMRKLGGRGGGSSEYLDVKHRLLWLRTEHPDAQIVTEHIRIDDSGAIFKATVSIPNGGLATGHGSETAADFGDYIEKAETKALGRALNALGYGAQFADQDDKSDFPGKPTPSRAKSQHKSQTDTSTDYSWSAFWRWAREQGFDSKDSLEIELGEPIQNLNPADLKSKLLARQIR